MLPPCGLVTDDLRAKVDVVKLGGGDRSRERHLSSAASCCRATACTA